MSGVGTCTQPPEGHHHVPVKMLGVVNTNDLALWGWRFPDRCSRNPDWWHALPPVNWTESSDHLAGGDVTTSVISVFRDHLGRHRLKVVLPRKINPVPHLEVIPFIVISGDNDLEKNQSVVRVFRGGEVVQEFTQDIGMQLGKDALQALAMKVADWCDDHFPGWQDPLALWD